jgi:hypothetical protein
LSESGVLTAERDGPHIKLTMQFPDGYDHAFMVERYEGVQVNDDGVEEEVWTPIHTGTAKFVQGDVDYEMARQPDAPDLPPQPLPGPRTYRALAYRHAETSPSGVRVLHTEGNYTDPITI